MYWNSSNSAITMFYFFCFAGLLAVLIESASLYPSQSNSLNFKFPDNGIQAGPQPFQISVDIDFIQRMVQKVSLYRPSIPLVGQELQWADGPPPQDVNKLASYWAHDYDWFDVQEQINTNFSHFTTTVPGSRNYQHPIPIHFIHERASQGHGEAMLLLLLHGWPSSCL